ncbi:hypothetical protein JCM11251_003727 [Rhodosporidiobolus azoricus]
MLLRLTVLSALTAAAHAALSLSQGKLAIVDSVGAAAVASTSFTSASPPSPLSPQSNEPYPLSPTDSLKLSFILQDDQDGKGVQPQQAALVWEPVREEERGKYGRDVVEWVKVNRKSGRGKWELDLSRAPSSLLSLSSLSPLSLTLLISPSSPSSSSSTPLRLPLGTFTFPSSLSLPFPFPPNEDLPRSWEVEKYDTQREIEWTFRKPEKRVGVVKAAIGTAMVAAPWAVFGGMLTSLLPSLRLNSPTPLSSRPHTLLFLPLLLLLPASFILFWLDLFHLNLLQALPAFLGLGVACAVSGRGALGEMRKVRVGAEKEGVKKVE